MSNIGQIKIKHVDGPTNGTSSKKSTHVRVTLIHSKERKRVYLDAYPVEQMEGGMFSMLLCSNESIRLEDMPRLNRKRLAELESAARAQLEARSGPAWDLVLQTMAKHSLAVDDGAPATVPA